MATEAAFLRPTSISPARTSRGEHAPEGEGAVSGHTPVAPQDDDYEYHDPDFAELTAPRIAPSPSGGVSLDDVWWFLALAGLAAFWLWLAHSMYWLVKAVLS